MKASEKKIVKQIRNGHISTFESLFRDYYEALCMYADHYLKDPDLAEEAVQDVFFNIWKNRENLKIEQSLKSYLFISTRNKCLKIIRSKNTANKYSDHIRHIPHQQVSTPEDELNAKELDVLIESTLKALPERTGEIFRMNRFQGLKYTEIAEKLSISVKTVEANMGKALKIFRRNLNEYLQIT